MTREEILAMEPGRELDSLVAEKVMGYKVDNRPGLAKHSCAVFKPNNLTEMWVVHAVSFSPSTDISAAWEVLGKLVEEGAEINVGYCDVWDCCIDYPIEINWRATAETAPEAICKAALIAVMGAFE